MGKDEDLNLIIIMMTIYLSIIKLPIKRIVITFF